jgi:hypothetical protein
MYTKLYSSLLTSSVWSEDLETRILWITLLALADREGFVFGSAVGLARQAVLPLEAVHRSLEKLMAADPESQDRQRDPERDGRRIEAGSQGGWRILNYGYYRDLKKAEDRREQVREAVRRYRASAKKDDSKHSSPKVSGGAYSKRQEVIKCNTSEADAEAEADAESDSNPKTLSTGEESLSHKERVTRAQPASSVPEADRVRVGKNLFTKETE